jgi:hypothetical protein
VRAAKPGEIMGESVKKLFTLAVVLSIASVIACNRSATVVNDNKNIAVTTNANTTSNAAVAPATADPAAPGSPTEVYKTAHIARQKKDVETLKKVFSKDVLEFFSEVGKEDKKSLDDMIREMCEKPIAGDPQVRNEKINGDKATVEYKDEDGSWKTMDFVKEDGAWKMTIPKGDPDKEKDDKDNK